MVDLKVEPRLIAFDPSYRLTSVDAIQKHLDKGTPSRAVVVSINDKATIAAYNQESDNWVSFNLSKQMTQFLKDNYSIKVDSQLLAIHYNPIFLEVNSPFSQHRSIPVIAETVCNNPDAINVIKNELSADHIEKYDLPPVGDITEFSYPSTNGSQSLELAVDSKIPDVSALKLPYAFDAFEGKSVGERTKPVKNAYNEIRRNYINSRLPIALNFIYAIISLSTIEVTNKSPPNWAYTLWGECRIAAMIMIGIGLVFYTIYAFYLFWSGKATFDWGLYLRYKFASAFVVSLMLSVMYQFAWWRIFLTTLGFDI